MTRLVEYVDELVQEVGPRPAGTQQEHQAAELIAARLDEFGMKVDIEEFPCARNIGWVRVLYYALCVGGAAVSVFFAGFRLIGIALIAVGVVLMLLDFLGKNPLFSLFKNSLSQNVIARYLPPGTEPQVRSRKVVILAHYDSARTMVQAAPPLVPYYAQLRRVIRAAMIVLVVLALLMLIPFPPIIITILSVIVCIAAVAVLLALLAEVINLFMPYNQGANCNGSSVGVLYGLAEILSSGVDIASMRRASAQAGRGRAAREGDAERGARGRRGAGAGADGRGAGGSGRRGSAQGPGRGSRSGAGGRAARAARATGAEADAGVGAGSAAGGVGGVGGVGGGVAAGVGALTGGILDRLQGKARPSASQQADEPVADAALGAQEAEALPRRTITLGETGQASRGPLQAKSGEAASVSVGDNLVNPFISQRPPLSEVEEANRLREEERRRRLEEQRKLVQVDADHTEDGTPTWFVKAKKAAEQKAERRRHDPDEPGIVRSRFADMPLEGRLRRAGDQPSEDEQAEDGAVEGAQAHDDQAGENEAATAAGTEAAVVPGTAAGAAVGTAAAAAGAGVAGAAVAGTATGAVAAAAGAAAGASAVSAPGAERGIPVERDATAEIVPAAGRGAASVERPRPIVVSGPAVGQDDVPPVQPPQTEGRAASPLTAQPDFTGLDRPAFRVLPGDAGKGSPVIVPTEAASGAGLAGAAGAAGLAGAAAASSDVVEPGGISERQTRLFMDSDPDGFSPEPAPARPRGRLRDLPSLSPESTGSIPAQQATLDTEPVAKEDLFAQQSSVVSATGAFVPLGTTGVMKPIGEDLLAYHEDDEIYVPDADDTSISEHYSRTGEYSEPELVNIPESRVKSFLGSVGDRFSGKKKERLGDSPANWLGVDKDFDARREGHEIGSWENFSEDDENWSGGAFGGASDDENAAAVVKLSHELLDKEVWLVALGANESKNAGLANLFANHGNELKSALFINLLGVGIGDLVFTISEGNYRPSQTDHRMQSLISSAAQSMAIPVAPVRFSAFATDGTEALKRGGRAISIMGLGNQVPVGWRWSDDEVSRLREDNLLDAAALVIETIKNS
jgi:hypothetical protein